MDIPADSPKQPTRYNVPKLEGAFTLQELVAMDIAKDPRLFKARTPLTLRSESCLCFCSSA